MSGSRIAVIATSLWLALYFVSLSALSAIYSGPPSALRFVHAFDTDECHLVVLEDSNQRPVLAKMIRSPDPEEQALLVIDCCGAAIASMVDAPVNRVQLLPDSEPWTGLEWYQQLTTLHQWAPGQSTEEALLWLGFTMHQRYRLPGSVQWQQWGPLPETNRGLSRAVIATMACHEDLARIAALDTFLGNADRSLPNLYYCRETDRFFGIDLAASFHRPLAEAAIQQIQRLVKEGFSEQELAALRIYRSTLADLYQAVPPDLMALWLYDLAQQSGLRSIEDRMRVASQRFASNYAKIAALIALLNNIDHDFILVSQAKTTSAIPALFSLGEVQNCENSRRAMQATPQRVGEAAQRRSFRFSTFSPGKKIAGIAETTSPASFFIAQASRLAYPDNHLFVD